MQGREGNTGWQGWGDTARQGCEIVDGGEGGGSELVSCLTPKILLAFAKIKRSGCHNNQ